MPSRAIGRVKLPKLSLRKFNGDLTSWTPFWESFKSSIHENNEITSVDKFNYLNSLLEGSAAAAIAGLTLSDANYNDAVTILTKRFGNRQQIVTKHMDALMGREAVTSNHNLKGLRRLYDLVETHTRSLCSLGIPSTSYGSLLSSVVMNKLRQEIRVSISKEVTGESLDLEAIMKIVEKEISARERATATVTVTSPVKKQPRECSVTASALLSNNSSFACSFCSQPHPSSDCGSVTDVGERKRILVKAGRCYNCLKKGHIGRDCRSPSKCSNCGGRHHLSICSRPKTNGPQDATRTSQQTVQNAAPTGQVRTNNEPTRSNGRPSAVVSMYVSTKTPVLLQTACVRVKAPDKTTPVIQTRVLLDSGSQRSYISSKLCNQLGLKENSKETLLVKTFAAEEGKVQVCSLVDLSVMTRDGLDMCLSLLSIPTICEPLTGQPINYATSRFQYLSGLDLADSSDGKDCLEVGVLIGVDQYWKIVTGKVVKGIAGPTAIETAFGWVLSGPVLGLTLEPTVTCLSTVHMMKVDASVCSAQQEIANLENRLQAFWDLETLGIKESETSVYDNFMESVSFNNGRYCVRLPWKSPRVLLPDNFDLSQKRLFNLLKRLRQTPHILTQYNEIIQEQIRRGIVEVVDPSDIGSMGITHYLPHHAVIKEDKQTSKLRIVYDASARSNGPSLNDCLYAGPTFGQNIMDILLRFRIHRVAVIADIEKAFLMVSVSEEDRDALRFLWIHDINAQLPRLVIMRFARVVFGVSASPFLLNATIRRHVEKYRGEDPLFVDKFNRSIYVDDLIFGAKTEDEALELFTKARLCLDKAGFTLRKFVSNSLNLQTLVSPQEHQAQVPGRVSVACEDESYTKNTLGERLDHPEYIKVLGVKWKPMDDTLICDLSNLYQAASELKPTKRNVIGLSARVYDPLLR